VKLFDVVENVPLIEGVSCDGLTPRPGTTVGPRAVWMVVRLVTALPFPWTLTKKVTVRKTMVTGPPEVAPEVAPVEVALEEVVAFAVVVAPAVEEVPAVEEACVEVAAEVEVPAVEEPDVLAVAAE